MTVIDKRGGAFTVYFTPVIDLRIALRFVSSSSAIDLTGQSVTAYLYYENNQCLREASYPATVTDAGDGRATVTIPASYFNSLENDGFGETVGILIARNNGAETVEQVGGVIQLTDTEQGGGYSSGNLLTVDVSDVTVEITSTDGLPGSAATVEVGTTTTLDAGEDADVSNSGTSSAAVLDFLIPKGDQGDPGFVPGLKYAYSTTVTDSDPGSGNLRFNNATFNSITRIFIDNEDSDAVEVSGQIDLWDDVSNAVSRGRIWIFKADDSAVVRVFSVTGAVTDGTGYRKIVVTPIHSSGTLTDADDVVLFFAQSGNDGAGNVDSVNGETGTVVLDPDDLDDTSTTNKFATVAQLAKVDYLTITQGVDLDTIESRVNELDAAVVLQGSWDASGGSFPGGGTAQSGHSYIVSTGGTVDGEEFSANDRIVAITDDASTTTYASNWLKLDYTDQVASVAGKTGIVTLVAGDIASGTFADARISESSVTQHATKKGQIEGVNAQTGTGYTAALDDAGKIITMSNASANTFTIPTNASVAFAINTVLNVTMLDDGITTIAADTGVTLNGVSAGSGDMSTKFQAVSIVKIGTDEWIAAGDIGTVA